MLKKVISGGQTGVDRGALDAAILEEVPHGGFCPAKRRAEDDYIPDKYQLEETFSEAYPPRTAQNVQESDGTLILIQKIPFSPGTNLTLKICREKKKPFWTANPDNPSDVDNVTAWIQGKGIKILNVAGSRESKFPGIQEKACSFVQKIIRKLKEEPTTT